MSVEQQPDLTGSLRVERSGAVATLYIDNPRRRNAVSKDMWGQFATLLYTLAEDDSVRVLVVRGAGENFSAGADISDLRAILHDAESGRHDGGHVSAGENALAAFPKPTIAAIDGYCVGGGWQIAGACDIRIASERAHFGITPSKIGIVYPTSGIERLVRLVGPGVAKQLLFSADFIDADEAKNVGLVGSVLPVQGFWEWIEKYAQHLAGRSALSIQAMKAIVDAIAVGGIDLEEINAYWQQQMDVSDDPTTGITAFLEKRAPEFTWNRTVALD
ncbi:enoyl-CoA hydratase/isomerase family protein [Glutamicibacter sp. AOP5-A2-18]|uniref:enoyl-CoA hydratase/isomerase family protein n=1 Tax=Glutamicibacter sp. AOP5-A2-18 TaxID=3457656 RepID=UPI004033B816